MLYIFYVPEKRDSWRGAITLSLRKSTRAPRRNCYFILFYLSLIIGRKHDKYFKDNELIHFIEADGFCEGN